MNFLKKHIWLILILLLAAILRLYKLDFQSPWLDELHTLIETDLNMSLKDMWDLVLYREQIPFFHFILVKWFALIFGHNIFILRLSSAIFGILSVFAIYKVGKSLHSKYAGLVASSLLAVSLFAIDYSQEARVYSMYMFFVIVSYYFFIELIKNQTTKNAVLLGVFSGLVINSHLVGILHLFSIGFCFVIYLVLIEAEQRKLLLKKGFLSLLVSLVFVIPIIRVFKKSADFKSFWIPELSWSYFIEMMTFVFNRSEIFFWFNMAVFILFLSYFGYKSFQSKALLNKNFNLVFITSSWIIIFFIIIIIKSKFGVSVFFHRYLIGGFPPFILVLSFLIAEIKSKKLSVFINLFLVGFLLNLLIIKSDYYNKVNKSQYDLVTNEIIKSNENTSLVVSHWSFLVGYYLNKSNGYLLLQSTLNDYVDRIRIDNDGSKSFWYVDGNFRYYELSSINQKFIDQNYKTKHRINKHDAWAVYFESLTQGNNENLDLFRFKCNHLLDDGKIYFFQNEKISYPSFNIENGRYKMILNIQSTPSPPIFDENAAFRLFVNDDQVFDFTASDIAGEFIEIIFEVKENLLYFELEYLNDIAFNEKDRNAILNNIKIIKVN